MAATGKQVSSNLYLPCTRTITWTAIGFKSECGILPDSGFVFGVTSVLMHFLQKLELFHVLCIKRLQAHKNNRF